MEIKIEVVVQVEKVSGKFAGKDLIGEEIADDVRNAVDSYTYDDGESQYEVTESNVEVI